LSGKQYFIPSFDRICAIGLKQIEKLHSEHSNSLKAFCAIRLPASESRNR